MKINYKTILILIFSVFLFSCKGKKSEITDETPQISVKNNHTWYYFTNNGYKMVDKLVNVPFQPQIPWTEAVRISCANNTSDLNDGNFKAFAIVNRLGVLTFENENISASVDVNLFADRTAGNLVFVNNVPLFSVYKSSFFNDTITDPNYKKDQSTHLFLIQFDSSANISYPLINCNNITDEPNSEITDFYWDGINWLCSIKTISDVKNSFSYVSFNSTVPLLTLSPSTVKNQITKTEIDVEEFRNSKQFLDYKNAPERIKSLLSGFDKTLPFEIEVHNAGGNSPRYYANKIASSTEKSLKAKAILSQSWSGTLFEDGTLFLEGALPGKHILRGGKPVAIRLPKLPAGFVYSNFVISGTTLYAGWEETSFYKTGRSGFIQVNLEKTLYSKII